MLVFHNYQSLVRFNKLLTCQTLYSMLCCCGYKNWNMTVFYIQTQPMVRINEAYRKKKGSTDILSFPEHLNIRTPGQIKEQTRWDRNNNLGRIYICTEYVSEYCRENSLDIMTHLNVLYAHGISHLLGFDHETEEEYAKMAPYERNLLEHYKEYGSDFDPLQQCVYESWNWDKEEASDKND